MPQPRNTEAAADPAADLAARRADKRPQAPLWRVRLLGGLELFDGRQRLTRLPSRAHVALLAMLALQPQRAHAREVLIERLWPGVALGVGRNRLRQVLSTLRSVLEPPGRAQVLDTDRTSLRVRPGAMACDVLHFEQGLRDGHTTQALAWYRGELLPGYYDEWIDDERNRLAALHERASEAVPPANSAAKQSAAPPDSWPGRFPGPIEEPLAGLPSVPTPAALSAAALAPVLDAEPRFTDMARASLPFYLTPLFGGDAALVNLRSQVHAARLVSLLGPGGSGKTRLAVELAHHLSSQEISPAVFAPARSEVPLPAPPFDLVMFVSLVACTRRADVADALAAALQLQAPNHDPLPAVAAALAGRRALLVLDNFEQLVLEAADLVAGLLARLPLLHVLATSRRALGLDGEHQWLMPALPLPDVGADATLAVSNPAVALFVDRARAARSDFELSALHLAPTIELVRSLQGLPLALELAASRMRSLSPAQVLQRLQAGGTPHLTLLARSGPRGGADPRHASMQQVVGWSWQQLGSGAQHLLASLSVLPASFTAATAGELGDGSSGDPALWLDELVSNSLLRAAGWVHDSERFALYEPVREYAQQHLLQQPAQAAAARARLRSWAGHWVAQQPPTPSLPVLRAEWPALVAAMGSALQDGVPAEVLHLLLALRPVLEDAHLPARALDLALQACDALQTGVAQGDQAAQPGALFAAKQAASPAAKKVANPAADHTLLVARARRVLAAQLYTAGRADEAVALAESALAAATHDAPPERARALHVLARVRWRTRRRACDVEPLLDEADAIEALHPTPDLRASLLALRAFVVNAAQGDHAAGEALHARALQVWQRLGNQHAINSGRYNLAVCAQNANRHAQTLQRLAPVLESARELQDLRRISQCLNVQGNAYSGLRQWLPALAAYRECVQVAWAAMAPFDLAYGFWNLPRALAHRRQPQAAVRLMAFSALYWEQRFGALTRGDKRYIESVRRMARLQLAPGAWDTLWAEGEALTPAQAHAVVLTEI